MKKKIGCSVLLVLFLILMFIPLFVLSDVFIKVKYVYIYDNVSGEVPVYREDLIEVKEDCFTNITTSSVQCNPAYSYTNKIYIGYKREYYDGDRIGIEINEEKIMGYVNVENNILSQWSVPIGERNFKEFGRCRDYEKSKGVCKEVDLLK